MFVFFLSFYYYFSFINLNFGKHLFHTFSSLQWENSKIACDFIAWQKKKVYISRRICLLFFRIRRNEIAPFQNIVAGKLWEGTWLYVRYNDARGLLLYAGYCNAEERCFIFFDIDRLDNFYIAVYLNVYVEGMLTLRMLSGVNARRTMLLKISGLQALAYICRWLLLKW